MLGGGARSAEKLLDAMPPVLQTVVIGAGTHMLGRLASVVAI